VGEPVAMTEVARDLVGAELLDCTPARRDWISQKPYSICVTHGSPGVLEVAMPDLLEVFRQKAEDLIAAIDRKGGVRGTIQSLRRQMVEADRRRAIGKVKAELKRLDSQITEMTTAVGVQAVGLHEAGALASPELQPLCEHILRLRATLAQQEAELAKLTPTPSESAPLSARTCAACGQPLPGESTFCPNCGARIQAAEETVVCGHCGAQLRAQARFCRRCGRPIPAATAGP